MNDASRGTNERDRLVQGQSRLLDKMASWRGDNTRTFMTALAVDQYQYGSWSCNEPKRQATTER